jgi:hypothetical protein
MIAILQEMATLQGSAENPTREPAAENAPANSQAAAAELAKRRCSCKHAGADECATERNLKLQTCQCRCHLLRSIAERDTIP